MRYLKKLNGICSSFVCVRLHISLVVNFANDGLYELVFKKFGKKLKLEVKTAKLGYTFYNLSRENRS